MYVYKVQENDKETLLKVSKINADLMKKHGATDSELFLIGTERSIEGHSTSFDFFPKGGKDEVWAEVDTYNSKKHMNEVLHRFENDEDAEKVLKAYEKILSGRSCVMKVQLEEKELFKGEIKR
jgi:hypothetical protein